MVVRVYGVYGDGGRCCCWDTGGWERWEGMGNDCWHFEGKKKDGNADLALSFLSFFFIHAPP